MSGSRFDKLVDLARDDSAERRRDLLREVANLFFQTGGKRSPTADELFDEVLQSVAETIHEEALVELACRLAAAPDAPHGLTCDLANRSIAVAGAILRQSPILTDQDLLEVVRQRSQAHIRAVAERAEVSECVAEAIAHVGDDIALDTLLRNGGAAISHLSFERIIRRARRNPLLYESLVSRADTPLWLLNDIFFLVARDLRRRILERNAFADGATLADLSTMTRRRRSRATMDMSDDICRANVFVQLKRASGELNAKLLIGLMRERQHARFLCGFAELAGVAVDTVQKIVARKDADALALVCRASDIDCTTFATLASLMLGESDSACGGFPELYNDIPIEGACRVMLQHRERKRSADRAAA